MDQVFYHSSFIFGILILIIFPCIKQVNCVFWGLTRLEKWFFLQFSDEVFYRYSTVFFQYKPVSPVLLRLVTPGEMGMALFLSLLSRRQFLHPD